MSNFLEQMNQEIKEAGKELEKEIKESGNDLGKDLAQVKVKSAQALVNDKPSQLAHSPREATTNTGASLDLKSSTQTSSPKTTSETQTRSNYSPKYKENPKVLELDLIKGETRRGFNFAQHFGALIFPLLITIIFIVEIYLGLNWWSNYENNRILEIEEKTQLLGTEIRSLQKEFDVLKNLEDRVDLSRELVSNYNNWTQFFAWLEKNTLSSVLYKGFSGERGSIYALSATARSYREVSWQARAFLADPMIESVSIDAANGNLSINHEEEEVSATSFVDFEMELKLNPDLFKNQSFN